TRPRLGYPGQYRDLRRVGEQEMPKSAGRCGIATLPNQHESGTFSPYEGLKVALAAGIAGGDAPLTSIESLLGTCLMGSSRSGLPTACRSPCRQYRSRGPSR